MRGQATVSTFANGPQLLLRWTSTFVEVTSTFVEVTSTFVEVRWELDDVKPPRTQHRTPHPAHRTHHTHHTAHRKTSTFLDLYFKTHHFYLQNFINTNIIIINIEYISKTFHFSHGGKKINVKTKTFRKAYYRRWTERHEHLQSVRANLQRNPTAG